MYYYLVNLEHGAYRRFDCPIALINAIDYMGEDEFKGNHLLVKGNRLTAIFGTELIQEDKD